MFEILKTETKVFHNSVEKVLIKELKQLTSIEEYYLLLKKLLYFYESVENRLQELIDESVVSDIRERRHIKRLKLDLNLSDLEHVNIINPFSTSIKTVSYALGVLYVIEGSTLGGQIISKMLKKQLALTENQSVLNYFTSYGENTPKMWKNLKMQLENSNLTINETELINGAKATFSELEQWLLKN